MVIHGFVYPNNVPDAPSLDLAKVAQRIRSIAREFVELCRKGAPRCSEENFAQAVERVLQDEVRKPLGIAEPAHEYKIGFSKHYGRADAYYGLVVFEYKRPYPGLESERVRGEAVEQVKRYIEGLRDSDEETRRLLSEAKELGNRPHLTGVILDGNYVVFVDYDTESDKWTVDPKVGARALDGVALGKMVRALQASGKKRLDARSLAADFGYRSDVAKRAVGALYESLARTVSGSGGRTKALFEEWRRLAAMAYPVNAAELVELADSYGVKRENVDGARLFFAVETYYALVIKLLAAEVASRFYAPAMRSFVESLREARDGERLRERLRDLEGGGPAAWYGISNLLEGQLFSWYVDEWDDELQEVVRDLVERLSEYDVGSLALDPRRARDVFKLLYEELVPREEVRQKLGIYTTPDWLAELILDELGLSVEGMLRVREEGRDPLDLRVLDPGVGTGTFLVLYLQRVGEYLRRIHGGDVPDDAAKEALRRVLRNVVGFDIEVLALMTARANYLIALAAAGLLRGGGEPIEIPVYMANSAAPAELMEGETMIRDQVIRVIKVPTSVCDCSRETNCCFMLPARLAEGGSVGEVLTKILDGLRNELEYEHLDLRKFGLSELEEEVLRHHLYDKLLDLKRRGVDEVWVPVIKSYALPALYRNRFDYVVGNPPWLSLRYLADPGYQEIIKRIAMNTYGLVHEEHLVTHLEMAALFLMRAVDYYAAKGGRVGFVMPRSIYSADQHHNLRVGDTSVPVALRKVIDCEGVQPLFYVPAIAVIAERGDTEWPVNAEVLSGRLPAGGHKVMSLVEAREHLTSEARRLFLNRIGGRSFLDYRELGAAPTAKSYYYDRFYQGATIVPQGAWFVRIVGVSPWGVIVETNKARVEERGHVDLEIGQLPVEGDFIYGVLTGAEVVPFCHLRPNLAVLPLLPGSRTIIRRTEAANLGKRRLVEYLERVEREWDRVRTGRQESTSVYEWLNYRNKLTKQDPKFKYKVVYLRSGKNLAASVVVDEPYELEAGGGRVRVNGVIVGHTLHFYQTNDADEADYLAAVLNSNVLNNLIKPMQSKGAFGERDIGKKPLEFPIPRYNPRNPLHRELSGLGRRAREIVCGRLNEALGSLASGDKSYLDVVNRYYDYLLGRGGGEEQVSMLTPNQVGRLRDHIRESLLRDVLTEIDERVGRLLSNSMTLDDFISGSSRA
jgi:hypothetical protein